MKESIHAVGNNLKGKDRMAGYRTNRQWIMKHGQFWILFMMFAACLLFYYFGEIINFFKLDYLRSDIFYTVHDLHRSFFLVPIVYGSYHFGIKGAFATVAFSFLSFMPRALFISPYVDPLLRIASFSVVACIIGFITAKATEKLIANEMRFRELFHNMGSGVAVYETHDNGNTFTFKDMNRAGERIDNIKRENLIGRSVTDVFPRVREFGLFDVLQRVWKTGVAERHPVSHYKDDRVCGWRDNYVYKLHTGEIVAVYDDVTERKKAEEKIQRSLREKELLLREVHHRVKNNMQVISGLLDLHARSSGDPELIEMLNENQRRIKSMALIHEILYNSRDFSRVDLADYARSLSQELFKSYDIKSDKIDLTIQTSEEVHVDIIKAIPCGLILNELISNTLRHAFPGSRQGKLQIIFWVTKNTEMEIVFRDNGVGLPDEVDPYQPKNVGLYLVNGLVKNQLDGQIEVGRSNGTEFRIRFPL